MYGVNAYFLLFAVATYLKLTNHSVKAANARNQSIDYEFTGPMPCQENEDIFGYGSLTKLNKDMYINAIDVLRKNKTAESEYIYVLCPNTIFDIDKATRRSGVHETIGIFLNNTIIRCGKFDTNAFGTCIVQGGSVQVVYPPELEVRNTVIEGITFTGGKGYGVAAYSHPSSDASFINCTWIENDAIYAVVIYYDPNYRENKGQRRRNLLETNKNKDGMINSRQEFSDFVGSVSLRPTERQLKLGYAAMSVQFTRCTFSDNVFSEEVINNQGGSLRIVETTFINNIVDYAVIGVAYGGKLSMEGNTHFQDNVSPFVPVFVDNDSYLNLNVDNTGKNNVGLVCKDGIFLEKENSYCMEGGKCEGDCCKFGDDTCDRFGSISEEMSPGKPTKDMDGAESSKESGEEEYKISNMKAPESATATYNDQKKTVKGLRVAIVLLAVALVLVIGLLIFKKKREHAFLGTAPDNVLD